MGAEIVNAEEGKENGGSFSQEGSSEGDFLPAPSLDDEVHEGQLIDVREKDEDLWSEAKVLRVENNRCLVSFMSYDQEDEWISVSSSRLAPYASVTQWQSGNDLKQGQQVDILDVHPAENRWVQGTIVEASASHLRVRYLGRGQEQEESLQRHSHRISPPGTHTRRESNDSSRLSRYLRNFSNRVRRASRRKSDEGESRSQYQSEKMLEGLSKERKREIKTEDPRMVEYRSALAQKGFIVHIVSGDGNCLFRAVSDQVYGTDAHHALVRDRCMSYMEAEAAYFEPFVLGNRSDFKRYIACKRQLGVWGDDIEIQAMCELYNRPAEIFAYDGRAGFRQLRTFHESSGIRAPMRLSFYGGGHYDSIVAKDRAFELLREPGTYEAERIWRSQSRNEQAQSGSEGSSGSSVGRTTQGRINEAQQNEIDEAVRKSRVQYDEQMQRSMEEILAQSLRLAKQHEDRMMEGAIEESVLSTAATEDDGLAIKMSDIAATEQVAMDQALAMSRQEYDVDGAVQQSLREVSQTEQQQIDLALRLSAQDAWSRSVAVAGSPMEEDEDEMLQRALEESIRDH